MDFGKFKKVAPATSDAAAPAASSLSSRGLLRGLSGTKPFEYGNYFKYGTYGCKVVKCLTKISGKGGFPLYIAEFDIVEVLDATPVSNRQGERCSMAQKLSDTKIAYPVLASLALAIANPQTPEDRDAIVNDLETIMEEAASEANPLAGEYVTVKAIPHITQRNAEITRLIFSPYAGPTNEVLPGIAG